MRYLTTKLTTSMYTLYTHTHTNIHQLAPCPLFCFFSRFPDCLSSYPIGFSFFLNCLSCTYPDCLSSYPGGFSFFFYCFSCTYPNCLFLSHLFLSRSQQVPVVCQSSLSLLEGPQVEGPLLHNLVDPLVENFLLSP